nr:Structural polyprotein CDS [Astacus astacus]
MRRADVRIVGLMSMLYISTNITPNITEDTADFEASAAPSVSSMETQQASQNTTNNRVNNPTPSTDCDAQQICAFQDDAPVTKASILNVRKDPESLIDTMVEAIPNEIADVLSRPYVVLSAQWTPELLEAMFTPPVPDLSQWEWKISFPQALFAINDIFAKLERYACFRADVCMRIMVNGTPFQAGKLWCYFSPHSEDLSPSRLHLQQHLSGLTGFPGAELDVSAGNVVELRIPYVSPTPFVDLTESGGGSFGDLGIAIINRMTVAPADLTVMAWFENVRLQVPTAAPLSVAKDSRIAHLEKELSRLKSIPETQGPVSDISGGVATIANTLADVPIVGTVAKPLGWIASMVHNVSSALGFSKPQQMSKPDILCNIPAAGFTNLDVADNSISLSTSSRPGVGPSKGLFATDTDEMDIRYITSKSCILNRIIWKKEDATNAKLMSINVCPSTCHAVKIQDSNMVFPTTLAFVSHMFTYWRGGLRYRISLAKTAFHTGRLRVVFIPRGDLESDYSAEFGTYSWVLDLRSGSELEFTIPYVSSKPYSMITPRDISVGDSASIGTLHVYVMNQLVCPDTVDPTVAVNTWISAADDFELALPRFNLVAPARIDEAEPPPPKFTNVESQMLGDASDALVHDEQGSSDTAKAFQTSSSLAPALACMGEKVTNLRPLTRRFGHVGELKSGTTYEFTPTGFVIVPYAKDVTDETYNPANYISTLYRFFRGGMRHKMIAKGNNSDLVACLKNVTPISWVWNALATTKTTWYPGCATHYQNSRFNNILEFETPQLSDNPIQLLGDKSSRTHRPLVNITSTASDAMLLGATADDATFAWLIGAPICKVL